MKKNLSTLLLTLLAFAFSACTSSPASPTQDVTRPMLARDAADSYSAEFHIQFTGSTTWSYLLKTRKSLTLREISLHIEGLASTQNPGDVRLVTDNTTSWMIGAGTDQQCVQFPNGKGMDPTFIYPESLVSLTALDGALQAAGEDQLEGLKLLHFSATGAATGPWKNASVDIWQERGTGMLRRFSMSATGEDPFFGAGSGKLSASYSAGALGSEAIQTVAGCEISVPLPDGISMFVRLPGMASFDSQNNIDELVKFYQNALPGQKWVEKDPPAQAQGDTVLSYQRGAEDVEIHIRTNPAGGSSVKLLFIQSQ